MGNVTSSSSATLLIITFPSNDVIIDVSFDNAVYQAPKINKELETIHMQKTGTIRLRLESGSYMLNQPYKFTTEKKELVRYASYMFIGERKYADVTVRVVFENQFPLKNDDDFMTIFDNILFSHGLVREEQQSVSNMNNQVTPRMFNNNQPGVSVTHSSTKIPIFVSRESNEVDTEIVYDQKKTRFMLNQMNTLC